MATLQMVLPPMISEISINIIGSYQKAHVTTYGSIPSYPPVKLLGSHIDLAYLDGQ